MKASKAIRQLQPENYLPIKAKYDPKTKYDHGSSGYDWFKEEVSDYGFDCLNENEAMDWMQQVARR